MGTREEEDRIEEGAAVAETRRAFLLELARGAAFVAPVVTTLAAVEPLEGQGNRPSAPGPPNKMMEGGTDPGSLQQSPDAPERPAAPWSRPPPGGGRPTATAGRRPRTRTPPPAA